MFDTLFGEGQYGLKMVFAFIVVFGLLALALWLVRRFGADRLGSPAARGRQPRLAVIDAATVDGRRRLVLVRRDNIEHLLIIGGPTDVVIEQNIVRGTAAPRGEPIAPRPATAPDAMPRPVPLEGSMWPLQPEPMPRLEPSHRPEAAGRPQRPAPTVEEAAEWAPSEPEPSPQAPPVAPRDRRARAGEPPTGAPDEGGRAPAPPDSSPAEQPIRAVEPSPRVQSRRPARPQLVQPPAAAAPDAEFNPSADQNLAEMAQRLEAALRRPRHEDAAPPGPRAAPASEQEPHSEAMPRPARAEPRAARPEARPPQRSLYDSLEQEMASLLSRPNGKG